MEELNRRDIAKLMAMLQITIEKDEKDYATIGTGAIKKLIQQSIKENKVILSKLNNIIEKY